MSSNDFKPEVWTTSSNEAVKISLVNSAEDKATQFPPNFTYPIYGEDESIFGYKDLVIHLVFDSLTFKPFVNAKYSGKLDNSEDVVEILSSFLPPNDFVTKDEEKWRDICEKEEAAFKLPSDKYKVKEYTDVNSHEFIVYKCNVKEDPMLLKLHRRIQIFSLMFIEGASYIDEDEPHWEMFWLFNKKTKNCLGYATTYKYWNYGGHKSFDSESFERQYKARISQFLILPPYQGNGHGAKLYKTIYDLWEHDKSIVEVTVEDPNESFDDLRDCNDLSMLKESGFFKALEQKVCNNDPIILEWLNEKREEFKLEKRQFERCIEMILLFMGKTDQYTFYVKRRLYLKNFEALHDIPSTEDKIAAIKNSFSSLTEDYERIIKKCTFSRKS